MTWIVIAATWIVFAALCQWWLRNPRGDVETGFAWNLFRLYAFGFQRLRIRGKEFRPDTQNPGPLIVVVNHTSGVDPAVVIAACRFEVRWIMAQDMRHPGAEWFWKWGNVIFVDRQKGDATGAREAIKHIKLGGTVGIFPEGGIERPGQRLLPFQSGVGLIIRRTGAPVLPVIIRGIPETPTAWGAYFERGHASVEFKPPIDYSATKLSAEEIAKDLQCRYAEWTGWPAAES